MVRKESPTLYAPSERANDEEIYLQSGEVSNLLILNKLLNSIPDFVMVLNSQRQIVFTNKSLMRFLDEEDERCVIGFRPGEVLDCQNAYLLKGGCGTTEFCKTCGAVNAIIESQKGRESVNECRITRRNGSALDLRVWASPLEVGGQSFVLFVVADISNEKRRMALERIFLHDIMNIVSGIYGYACILEEAGDGERREYLGVINRLSRSLVEEIEAQRQLLKAEQNELEVKFEDINVSEILKDLTSLYSYKNISGNNCLKLESKCGDVKIISDRGLLLRVLGNMVKNALEASTSDQAVTVGCEIIDDHIRFWVHNEAYIPRINQLQVFHRSFSTRGKDRGLGTYSMKLLSERYLKGEVSFRSTKKEGTTFSAIYPIKHV